MKPVFVPPVEPPVNAPSVSVNHPSGSRVARAWARGKAALLGRWKWPACAALVLLVAGAGVAHWLTDHGDEEAPFQLQGEVPAHGEGLRLALRQSFGVQMQAGHELKLENNGEVFDAVVRDLEQARSSMHLLLYIWEKGVASDRVVAALTKRARAGVACRVLVDAFGSPDFEEDVQAPLVAAGCEVRIFRPSPSDKLARNHRKIVVVDGSIGYTGGFGIRDNWLGDGVHNEGWRDTNVRFVGPAVADAQQAFAENWQEAGGALLPAEAFPNANANAKATGAAAAAFISSSASPSLTRAERLTQLMIAAAKRRLWIANAYFVPSEAILELLSNKAKQGVDVRLLVPGRKSDSKTSFGAQQVEYGSLTKSGVRVWEYQPSMMHSKTMLIDDSLALVGSVNLEPLSLRKLEEGAIVVDDAAFASELARSFEADCRHAELER